MTNNKTSEQHIFKITDKNEERVLREKTKPFDFSKFSKKEISDLLLRMKKEMRNARGIGLSANQIGLRFSVFVAEVPIENSGIKFYAVFNPKIEKLFGETSLMEEGCLSIPSLYGNVERPSRITISGFDKSGKELKIKAWGLLARVLQHEIDHLNGKLFIDRTKNIYSPEERQVKLNRR